MANEYAVNTADLTGVADTIRETAGTSELIPFPEGWKTAIRALSGIGMNLHVVGGTTQPTDAKENTIWVNTSVDIGKWTVSLEAPESPAIGDVWIEFNAEGGNELDIGDANSVIIVYRGVYQYTSDGWILQDANVDSGSGFEEIDSDYFLYKLNKGFTVEFGSWSQQSATPVINDTTLAITGTQSYSDNTDALLYTLTPVDVSGWNTLEIVLEIGSLDQGGNYTTFGLCETVNTTSKNQTWAKSKNVGSVTANETVSCYLDVSELSGDYYFAIGGFGLYYNVKQIYLRKGVF